MSGTFHNTFGYYQVSGVDGRTGIFFHNGSKPGHSKGCIILGSSGSYDNEVGGYKMSGSTTKVEILMIS